MTIVNSAAIVCEHVASGNFPILYATRTEPLEPEDSGWQFLCHSGLDEDDGKAQVWSIGHVIESDPNLMELIERPIGTILTRKDTNSVWTVKNVGN